MKKLILSVLGLLSTYSQFALSAQITPVELLRRAMLRDPMMVSAASKSNQFAGRTTISSGSATQVVSTSVVNSDSLIFHTMVGNANVASGSARFFEVKTIAPGAYFTFGTQDGATVPRDTILLWEMRRTS